MPVFAARTSPDVLHWGIAAVVLICLFFAAYTLIRAQMADATYSAIVGCNACFYKPALAHDLTLLAAILGYLTLLISIKSRLMRVLLVVPILILLALLLADLAVFKLLSQRLLIADLFKYRHEFDAISIIARKSFSLTHMVGAVTLLLSFIIIGIGVWRTTALPHALAFTGLAIAILIASGAGLARKQFPGYVHADAYQNWVELNLSQQMNAPYSAQFLQQQKTLSAPAPVCTTGQGKARSVILVLVESLSSYHSDNYAAKASFVPKLDALARQHGTWFENFYANGFTTDGGMIAALGGRTPIPGFNRYSSMDAFTGFADPALGFAKAANDSGLLSAFFTTGTLSFVDKQSWLKQMQFTHFEGSEAPFYADKPRALFNAADDSQLFARFNQWRSNEISANQTFAAALLTVGTHQPFLIRETGAHDEPQAFAKLDRSLVDFYKSLANSGFFEDGILLITGDHRAMTPMRSEEVERYSESAFARVPMFVFGASDLPKGALSQLAQQQDIPISLRDLVSPRQNCRAAHQGLILRTPAVAATQVLHARGMPRDQIDLYTADASYALKLAGNSSRWITKTPTNGAQIAADIHLDRTAREPNSGDFLETIIGLYSGKPSSEQN
jgi:lipoteichoic acid synthase